MEEDKIIPGSNSNSAENNDSPAWDRKPLRIEKLLRTP